MIKEISTFLPHSACVSSEGLTPLKDETDPVILMQQARLL